MSQGRQVLQPAVSQLAWISNVYILGLMLVIPLSSWLARRMGAKSLFMLSALRILSRYQLRPQPGNPGKRTIIRTIMRTSQYSQRRTSEFSRYIKVRIILIMLNKTSRHVPGTSPASPLDLKPVDHQARYVKTGAQNPCGLCRIHVALPAYPPHIGACSECCPVFFQRCLF
ncbi:hypothetical protein B7764_22350 (plasmid) [Pantoea ananatis]|nr:hypothetical protein B7764_22350 [Pantoea ananatis]